MRLMREQPGYPLALEERLVDELSRALRGARLRGLVSTRWAIGYLNDREPQVDRLKDEFNEALRDTGLTPGLPRRVLRLNGQLFSYGVRVRTYEH